MQLTQERFPFDTGEPFNDSNIAAYLAKLGRELTDDQLQNFCRARHAYDKFRRLGTGESRRNAWLYVTLVARQSAKTRHISGEPDSHGGVNQ